VKDPHFAQFRSDISGIAWPPISTGLGAALAALLRQLDSSQWMPQADIVSQQHRQLVMLAEHCAEFSPHFRRRLDSAGLQPDDLGTPQGLRRLPVLRRRDIQTATDLFCVEIPKDHAPLREASTSGSSGEPVRVRRSAVSDLDWMAFTLRDHIWHRRDFRKPMCAIRANVAELVRAPDWGSPANLLAENGPSLVIPITTPLDTQVDLIRDFAPDNLLIYPSNLAGLLRAAVARGVRFDGLRHLRTIGETLSPALREQARRVCGLEIADAYSSQEIGYFALQCPGSANYHVMAEAIIVEIVDEHGESCAPQQWGRVVVTDLHNFATPLIRYDIGDYAQAGPDCACGRGLPTLARIHGRERNLILMPDGTRHWPLVGFDRFREIAPVTQYQFIQTGRESVEARLVVERALTRSEETALSAHVQVSLGYPFALTFVYFKGALPLGANGKFEEFICRVAPN
jgi:phenylacetate-CoA ligase